MVEISAQDLADNSSARLCAGAAERVCRGCVIDSRQVEKDSLFVAFPGEKVDGNDFAQQALENGAGAVVMTREPSSELKAAAEAAGAALLSVSDPTEFMLELAAWYRDRLSATVIGVTGSIGKTTTKDTLAALLARRYRVWVTKGNFNNLIGMPMTILSAPQDTEMLILEMGMNHTGEIDRLTRCARPAYAIVTKVGTSHIGILGSRENIARAKAEIVSGMEPTQSGDCLLILGGEDDFTPFIRDSFATPAGIPTLLVGTGEGDAVRGRNIHVCEDGCPAFDIDFEDGSLSTKLSIFGAQSVPNALYAAALAHRLGIPFDEIDAAFHDLAITGRRQDIRRARSGARVIDDTYNASPESTAAALNLLMSLECKGNRIAVLGEIGELGDEARRLHELTGAYAAGKHPDILVCVGGVMAEAMADAARMMGMSEDDVYVSDTWETALAAFGDVIVSDDLVLAKGSRFVELDRFVEGIC